MLIIGVAVGTGCGKTTVVNQISNELPRREVGIISQDSYYHDQFIEPMKEFADIVIPNNKIQYGCNWHS